MFVNPNKKGFTLIELLVVISIISILSVIGLVVYQGITAKGRDSVRKSDLNKLAMSLEIYAQQNNGSYIGNSETCSTTVFHTAIAAYMSDEIVPKDPKTADNYCYLSTDGSTYTLCADLENDSDPERNTTLCPGYDYVLTPK